MQNEAVNPEKQEVNRNIKENEEFKLILQIYQADREELMKRVQQRDSYIIQFIVAVGALFCGSDFFSSAVLLLIPVLSLHYKYQMDCSYAIHEKLVDHIKEIETYLQSFYPEISENLFWQFYVDKTKASKPLGRRSGANLVFHFLSVVAILIVSFGTGIEAFVSTEEMCNLLHIKHIMVGQASVALILTAIYVLSSKIICWVNFCPVEQSKGEKQNETNQKGI